MDGVYFNHFTLQDAQAVQVRTALYKRIMTTRAWERHVRDRSTSTEYHFGPAVAVVLFNEYWGFQPPPQICARPPATQASGIVTDCSSLGLENANHRALEQRSAAGAEDCGV